MYYKENTQKNIFFWKREELERIFDCNSFWEQPPNLTHVFFFKRYKISLFLTCSSGVQKLYFLSSTRMSFIIVLVKK